MPRENKSSSVTALLSYPALALPFIFLLMDCMHAHAQTLPNRRYTTRDGLVADRVTVVAQDDDGYMWMGSLFGLSRYDGSRFTTIRLPASQQYKYVTSPVGGRPQSVCRLLIRRRIDAIQQGQCESILRAPGAECLGNDIIGLYDDDKGILVINSMNEVFHFDNEKFDPLFTLDSSFTSAAISSLVRDRKQRIWVGTGYGLGIFENGKMRPSFIAKDLCCTCARPRAAFWW